MQIVLAVFFAILSLFLAVMYCISGSKKKVFIASIGITTLLGCFALSNGHLSQYILIILPVFAVSDILVYYFSDAMPSVHTAVPTELRTKAYNAFFLWLLSLGLLGLLYKFIFSGDGSWLSYGPERAGIGFSQLGQLFWGQYFFISILLIALVLLSALGAMLMVKVKD